MFAYVLSWGPIIRAEVPAVTDPQAFIQRCAGAVSKRFRALGLGLGVECLGFRV